MQTTLSDALEPLKLQRDDFPNPFAPALEARQQMSCVNQRRRRATILANARQLLEREGYFGVGLRAVAERSEVSIQTVYNLVGNRTTLLAEAVVEHIGLQGKLAFERAGYPNPVIALSDVYWEGAALYPAYTRNASMTYFPPDRPLFAQISRRGSSTLRDGLRRMDAQGLLRPADHQAVAARIASMTAITVLDGLSGYGGLLDLRRELVASAALILMTVVTPAHAVEIDRWLQNFEALPEGAMAA